MDFFEHQDLARRATRRLVLLMTLAVLALIALTTALFAVASFGFTTDAPVQLNSGHFWQNLADQVGWSTLLWISLVIALVVLAGSLFKWLQLRGGGQAVAEALGGRLIPGNTSQANERQLLNIVEEMAIASGTPVPPVYLMDESGINAFAAGHSPRDAVIGVTRGSLEQLNRAELQGVIAHEFSHILHGDMGLNLRLVAILNGILIIGLLGYMLVRGGAVRGVVGRRRNNHIGIVALGLGLIILGAVGTFFGRWIKSAVSRQREFLADASAVQYTRNPDGIGGALMRIGGAAAGSRLETEDAEEFSHMYFSAGLSSSFSRMMATHPPLEERIKRVLPGWDGTYPSERPKAATSAGTESATEQGHPGDETARDEMARKVVGAVTTSAIMTGAGAQDRLQPEQLAHARALLEAIPESLKSDARDPFTARGVLFGLLLAEQETERAQQWQLLGAELDKNTLEALAPVIETSARLPEHERLPAIELAMPALKQLSKGQRADFLQALDKLIRADGRVSLREWILYRIAQHNLSRVAPGRMRLKLRYCQDEARLLLSITALTGAQSADAAWAAYSAGAQLVGENRALIPGREVTLAQLDHALGRLTQLLPLEKPALLKALKRCIQHDDIVTPSEAELYRALSDALNCPTPPLDISAPT